MLKNTSEYLSVIENIKSEITAAQYRAAIHVNADMFLLYYDIGCVINDHKSWGNKFIDNLAADIRIAFPESKGYSVRTLKYMAKFAETYPDREFVQRLLHKFHGGTILFFWIRLLIWMNANGISKSQQKMAGLEMFLFIRLKANCINGRFWRIKLQILNIVYHRRKVNWRYRL